VTAVRNADEAATLHERLGSRTVAVAESCTGGLLAQALTGMPGSGDWFRGGVVAYQRDVKFDLLGVTPGPVVTERAAREMARGVADLLGADAAVSITGAAGPEPHDGVPPGTVVVGVVVDGRVAAREYHFEGSPDEVCRQARDAALDDLERALSPSIAGSDSGP
jgi:nicotinamide-nucleotide amidase